MAGEIGHTTIDTEGRRCKCGNYGCLEAYASGPNIAIRAIEAIEAGAESRLPAYVGGDLRQITAQTVYLAAQEGDELALEVVNDTAKFLGVGIGNLLNVFNPEVVVVCGGVTLAGDHLFVPLRREVARRAFKPAVAACRIVPGELRGHRRRLRRRQGVPGPDGRGCLRSASSARWCGTSSTAGTRWRPRPRSGAASPTRSAGWTRACRPTGRSCRSSRSGATSRREAAELLRGLARLTPGGRCVEVPAPNNRVVCTTSRASGAASGCRAACPAGPGSSSARWCGISTRSTSTSSRGSSSTSRPRRRSGRASAGPIYADLHSLFLGMQHDGMRMLQPLPDAAAWFGCFDVVQLNEDEMRQLSPDPLSLPPRRSAPACRCWW